MINFWSNRYFDIEAVKYKYDLQVENKIYLIHPKCLIKGDSYKDGVVVNVIRNGYKRIIPKISKISAIISMDEINIAETENYYGISLESDIPIIRLPMNVDLIDKNKVIKEGYETKIIMTSCRADFPYKGYVVGLVDVFVKLKSKFSEAKLLIVCDGEDVGILKEKISDVPKVIQKDIALLGWMSYEELKDYMNSCMLYIGMGSSVLDSSLRYKPSAVIKFYTMDCIGKDYTAENPIDLAARDEIKDDATDMLTRVLKMNFEEYKAFSEKSFSVVSKMYGVDDVMNQFMKHHTGSNESILSLNDYLLIRMNNLVNSIRFKNKKEKSSVRHLTNSQSET